MTTKEFRKIALNSPDVSEKSHFAHPDFRVRGKIFATLGYPRKGWGVVILSPKLQKAFVESDPDAFLPVKGKWGFGGQRRYILGLQGRAMCRRRLSPPGETRHQGASSSELTGISNMPREGACREIPPRLREEIKKRGLI